MIQAQPPIHIFKPNLLASDAKSVRTQLCSYLGADVNIFYSAKTNPYPGILDTISATGWNLEATSQLELAACLDTSAEEIALAGALWNDTLVSNALRSGRVRTFILDNKENAIVLDRALSRLGSENIPPLEVLLRIHDGDSHFGHKLEQDHLAHTLKHLAQFPSLIFGCHIHRNRKGSHHNNEEVVSDFENRLQLCLRASEVILRITNSKQNHIPINLGGGIDHPNVYRINPEDLSRFHNPSEVEFLRSQIKFPFFPLSDLLTALGKTLQTRLRARPNSLKPIKLFFEFGRLAVARSFDTEIQVASIKENFYPEGPIYITTGNTALLGALHREVHSVSFYRDGIELMGKKTSSFIYGNLPHSGDWLFYSLPCPDLVVGDSLLIQDTGAYFRATEFGFGHELPQILSKNE